MEKPIKILAIETSCDETAAAVIGENPPAGGGNPIILSNIISSQIDIHAKTGGVVPEVASRAHMEAIMPVVIEALLRSQQEISNSEFLISNQIPNSKSQNQTIQQAIKILQNEIDYIAVTAGPGLVGSLLVGFNAAKTIAYALDKPIIPINHIEGHIYSAFSRELPITNYQLPIKSQLSNSNEPIGNLENDKLNGNWKLEIGKLFPILALTVSGGHTSLTLMKDHGQYETVGATLDDAVGEAYDKVAKLLGLGYPGGPVISEFASKFRVECETQNAEWKDHSTFHIPHSAGISFPRPIINDGTFNFSFSGLKTAVLVWVKKYLIEHKIETADLIPQAVKGEIAYAFEEAVKDVLVTKTGRAIEKYRPASVIFAGGVSANQYLRESLKLKVESLKQNIQFLTPKNGMFGDNAAMIGLAAYYHVKRGDIKKWNEIEFDSNLEL